MHSAVSNLFKDKDGFEWKYSKTGGCTGYADRKKFLAITSKGPRGAALNILKDFEFQYRLPNIKDLITEHIRPYNVEKPGTAAFGEQFRIIAPQNSESKPFDLFKSKIDILLALINRSYDLATIHREKIMVVYDEENKLEKATDEDLERQKMYLDPDHRYDY